MKTAIVFLCLFLMCFGLQARVVTLYEDSATFKDQFSGRDNAIVGNELLDVFHGTSAISVSPQTLPSTATQVYNNIIPSWNYNVVANPTADNEVRWIMFAWKKLGGKGIMMQFANNGAWGQTLDAHYVDPPTNSLRYVAGENLTGWTAIKISPDIPSEWTIVIRDLYADFGNFTLSGVALTPFDGTGIFDSIYLGWSESELRGLLYPSLLLSYANITVVSNLSAIQKSNASIDITINTNAQIAGYQMDISFTPSIVKANGVIEGNFLSSSGGTQFLKPTIDNNLGTIRGIACAKQSVGGVNGIGKLFTIQFKTYTHGESNIQLQNVLLSDPSGKSVPVLITNGKIKVSNYPSWDVDQNGRVDIFDLVSISRAWGQIVSLPLDINPDVNGDGKVNIFDLVLVCQHFGETYTPGAPSANLYRVPTDCIVPLSYLYDEVKDNPDPTLVTAKVVLEMLLSKVDRTQLLQNYPNPFNPETWIPYRLKDEADVIITIRNIRGELVRELNLGHKAVGQYITRNTSAYWDGRNELGELVSSGIYFYNIHAGGYNATMKMIVAK